MVNEDEAQRLYDKLQDSYRSVLGQIDASNIDIQRSRLKRCRRDDHVDGGLELCTAQVGHHLDGGK